MQDILVKNKVALGTFCKILSDLYAFDHDVIHKDLSFCFSVLNHVHDSSFNVIKTTFNVVLYHRRFGHFLSINCIFFLLLIMHIIIILNHVKSVLKQNNIDFLFPRVSLQHFILLISFTLIFGDHTRIYLMTILNTSLLWWMILADIREFIY